MEAPRKRLLSLDIFRGITVAAMILVNTPGDWDYIFAPLEHSKWNGCTPTDIIFPAFLYIVGISIVLALQKKRPEIKLHKQVIFHGLKRMVILILLGLFIHFFYRPSFATLRYPGVLQRIGVVYFVVMLAFLKLSDKYLNYLNILSLLGYFLLMRFVPIPGGQAPNLEPSTNLGAYLDRLIFTTNHLYPYTKTWDPVGLLSTIPAISTTLLGVKTGQIIRNSGFSDTSKLKTLSIFGTLMIILGLVWSFWFPINKSLWSSSYVLYTAGICTLIFALIFWIVDIKGKMKIEFGIFIPFGVNALAAYFIAEILPGILNWIRIPMGNTHMASMKWLNYQFALHFAPKIASLMSAICFLLLMWLIMVFFYRRKVIIKL